MDPNVVLTNIRRLLEAVEFQVQPDTGLVDLDDACELIDAFRDLDGWLSRGGFLPADWER